MKIETKAYLEGLKAIQDKTAKGQDKTESLMNGLDTVIRKVSKEVNDHNFRLKSSNFEMKEAHVELMGKVNGMRAALKSLGNQLEKWTR